MEDSKKVYVCTETDYEHFREILDSPMGRRLSFRRAYDLLIMHFYSVPKVIKDKAVMSVRPLDGRPSYRQFCEYAKKHLSKASQDQWQDRMNAYHNYVESEEIIDRKVIDSCVFDPIKDNKS